MSEETWGGFSRVRRVHEHGHEHGHGHGHGHVHDHVHDHDQRGDSDAGRLNVNVAVNVAVNVDAIAPLTPSSTDQLPPPSPVARPASAPLHPAGSQVQRRAPEDRGAHAYVGYPALP